MAENSNQPAELYGTIPLQNNAQTEATVLATFINYPDSYFHHESTVTVQSFEEKSHQAIFQAIKTCGEKSKIDIITVKDALVSSGYASYANQVLDYVDEICYSVNTDEHIEEHLKIIHKNSLGRGLIGLAHTVQNHVLQKMDPEEIANYISGRLMQIMEINRADEFNLNKVLLEVTNAIANKESRNGIKSRFPELDEFIFQLDFGDTVIIAAPPGAGKSSFMIDLARRSIMAGDPFLIFSLETEKEALIRKIISAESGIPLDAIRRCELTPEQWALYHEAIARLEDKPLFIEDKVFDLYAIGARIKYYVIRHGVRKVAIDYIQLVEVSLGKGGLREQEIAKCTRYFKKLAQQLGIVIIELSQLSRGIGNRASKRPMLSDLRESGAIEQDAVRVIFLYFEDYYNPELFRPQIQEIEVIVAKSRNTKLGSFKVNFDYELSKFISKYDVPMISGSSYRGDLAVTEEEQIDYFPNLTTSSHANGQAPQQTSSQDSLEPPF